MGNTTYPNLGFDPAPGMTERVASLSTCLQDTARQLDAAYQLICEVSQGGSFWQGEAASAFKKQVGDLPTYLENGKKSLTKVVTELDAWEGELAGFKKKAEEYERQAAQAKQAVQSAEDAYTQASRDPDLGLAGQYFPTQQEYEDAQRRYQSALERYDAAKNALDQANDRLDDIIAQAKRLLQTHDDTADDHADRIKNASDNLAPPEPGLLDKIGDALSDIGGWIKEHGGDILAAASAICGIIAIFCPVFAIPAVLLSVGALGLHVWRDWDKLKSGDIGAWIGVGGDLLGAIPGIGALRSGAAAFRAARAGEEGLGAAIRGFGSAGAWDLVLKGGGEEAVSSGVKWVATKLGGGEIAARNAQIGLNAVSAVGGIWGSFDNNGALAVGNAGVGLAGIGTGAQGGYSSLNEATDGRLSSGLGSILEHSKSLVSRIR